MSLDTLARINYAAASLAAAKRSTPFDGLTPAQQTAWRAGAAAVANQVLTGVVTVTDEHDTDTTRKAVAIAHEQQAAREALAVADPSTDDHTQDAAP